jgi:hypothetical protein
MHLDFLPKDKIFQWGKLKQVKPATTCLEAGSNIRFGLGGIFFLRDYFKVFLIKYSKLLKI